MNVFLSYAAQDRAIAQEINQALYDASHEVFFDRDDLPPGEEFHQRIRRAIVHTDLFVFLISEDGIDPGSYTLTELEIAEKYLKRAAGQVLPVLLRPMAFERLPVFLKTVTVLEPRGNVVAAVVGAVDDIDLRRRRKTMWKVGGGVLAGGLIALVAFGIWSGVLSDEPAAEITGTDGAPAVLVPAGMFTMGDGETAPRRDIYLDSFYIDTFEVTTARYAKFLAATGAARAPDHWETLVPGRGDQLPVIGVDWHDAAAYCEWVDRRLATDAEWEKAARGTDLRRYPWGDGVPTPNYANYQNSSPEAYNGGLSEVGSYAMGSSPFGVNDLVGNAAEWVADWYSESFPRNDVRNPRGPETGTTRVVRGSDRFAPPEDLAVTRRYFASPDLRVEVIGFRCARDVR